MCELVTHCVSVSECEPKPPLQTDTVGKSPGTFHSNFATLHTHTHTHNTRRHTFCTQRTRPHDTRSFPHYCVTYRAGSLLPDSALVDWEER
jgi:hypothetical protein